MQKGLQRFLALLAAGTLLFNATVAGAAAPQKPAPGAKPTQVMGAKKATKIQTTQSGISQQSVRPSTPSAQQKRVLDRATALQKRTGGAPAARPDELIIKYKPGVTVAEAAAVKAQTVRKFAGGAELVKLPPGSSVLATAASLRRTGKVEYAEPNYQLRKSGVTPNDNLFPLLWGMQNTGQDLTQMGGKVGTPGYDVRAANAWEITTGNPGLVIGVIDSGIDFRNPDLSPSAWVNPGEICGDGVDNEGNGYVDDCNGFDFLNWDGSVYDPEDLDGDGFTEADFHGTHVAGTIAAAMNNGGVVGVAPGVKLMSLKFLDAYGDGYTSDAIAAIDYAAKMGVKILNASWGMLGHNQALYDAMAANPNILFVAAAGNEGLDMDDLDPATPVASPAGFDLPNIISVAAVDNTGALADFSNYGSAKVDLAAPGVLTLSTGPTLQRAAAGVENVGFNYKSVFWGFGLDDLSATDAQNALSRALNFLGMGTAAKILVVLDDESTHDPTGLTYPSMQPKFQAALSGYSAVTYQTVQANSDGPVLSKLQEFQAVIWTTGHGLGANHPSGLTLTAADVSTLDAYLAGGGKLLLTGPDAIWGNELTSFVTQRLGVRYLSEGDPRRQLTGEAVTSFEGALYNLVSPAGSHYRDTVRVTHGVATAREILTWTPNTDLSRLQYWWADGTSMAAPHVTGVAALLQSANPDWNALQIKQRIVDNVQIVDGLRGKMVYPGIVDAFRALSYSPDNDVPGVPYTEWGKVVTNTLDGAMGSDLDDVYSVYLKAGEKVKVWMTSAPGTDFDLYLFGPTTPTVNDISYMVAASDQFGYGLEERIEFTAPASGEYYVDVFAYEGQGNYTLRVEWGNGPGLYDDKHPALTYSAGWQNNYHPDYMYSAAAGQTMTFKFYGETINLHAWKGPNMGLATVSAGGVSKDVDLWAPSEQPGALVYTMAGLPRGQEHTLTVTNKGMRSPSGKKTAIGISVDFIHVAVDMGAPAPVAWLEAYPGSNKVELFWPKANMEADFAGYKLYRSTNGVDFQAVTGVMTPGALANKPADKTLTQTAVSDIAYYVDRTALNGTEYWYYVVAVDKAGNQSSPTHASTSVRPDPAPAPVATPKVINGNNQVHLFWASNTEPDMQAYVVKRATGTSTAWETLTWVIHGHGAPEHSYTDPTAVNETDYRYVVWAVDTSNVWSESATPVNAHPSAPPAPVGPINYEMDRTNGVRLSWAPVTDAAKYVIIRLSPMVAEGPQPKWGVTTTSFTDPITNFTTDYVYQIQAYDSWGVGSEPTQVVVRDMVGPLPVTNLQATARDGAADLTWNYTDDGDLSWFMVSVGGTAIEQTVTKVPGGSMSHTVGGLSNGTTYTIYVTPYDTVANQGDSVSVTVTPAGSLAAPTGLAASTGDRKVSLNWNAVADATGYQVYVDGSPGPSVPGTSITLGQLTNGREYCFQVATVKGTALSPKSASVCATPVDLIDPNPVTDLRVVSEINSVSLAWTHSTSTDLFGYWLMRGTSPTGPWTLVKDLTGNSATDNPPMNGTTYYYHLVALDDDGRTSAMSNVVSARPHDGVAPEPVIVVTNTPSSGKVRLDWVPSPSGDVVHYLVTYREGFNGQVQGPITVFGSWVEIADLMDQTTYYFEVVARDYTGLTSTARMVESTPGTGPVSAGTYASSNGRITFQGYWPPMYATGLYRGHAKTSAEVGAYAELTFDGNRVSWNGFKFAQGGFAEVYIDGVKKATVDLYAANDQWGSVLYTSEILPAGTHTIRVVLVAGDGVRPSINITLESFKVEQVDLPPAAPTGVSATAGDGVVTVQWAAVPEFDIKGYNVYRSTALGTLGTKVNTGLITNVLFYEDRSVVNGTTYYYSVKAVDLGGQESAASVQKSAKPMAADTTPPTRVNNLKASASNQQVLVTWDPSSDETALAGYVLLWGTGSTEPVTWSALNVGNVTQYVMSGLVNGTTYWFKVQAYDLAGNHSSVSSPAWARPNQVGVGAGTYENNSTSIQYTSTWSTYASSTYSGGSVAMSSSEGATATLVFQGTSVEWLGFLQKSYGIVAVFLDGVQIATVDLYSDVTKAKIVAYGISDLTPGVHEIRIVRTGSKNPLSSGTGINLDAFIVR